MKLYTIQEMIEMQNNNQLDFQSLYQGKGFKEINTTDYFIQKYEGTEVVENLKEFKDKGIKCLNDRGRNKFEWLDRSDMNLLNENVDDYLIQ